MVIWRHHRLVLKLIRHKLKWNFFLNLSEALSKFRFSSQMCSNNNVVNNNIIIINLKYHLVVAVDGNSEFIIHELLLSR